MLRAILAAMLLAVGTVACAVSDPLSDPCPTDPSVVVPAGLAYATRDSAICIVTSEGTTKRIYRGSGSLLEDLVWSPDGSELGLEDWGRPEGEQYVTISPDGSGIRALPDRPYWSPISERVPQTLTSPNGEWVAHYTLDARIMVSRPDGRDLRIVSGGLDAIRPTWAPDSEWLAFQTAESWPSGVPDVWVVRLDGSSLSRLAVGAGFPAWRVAERAGQTQTVTVSGTSISVEPRVLAPGPVEVELRWPAYTSAFHLVVVGPLSPSHEARLREGDREWIGDLQNGPASGLVTIEDFDLGTSGDISGPLARLSLSPGRYAWYIVEWSYNPESPPPTSELRGWAFFSVE